MKKKKLGVFLYNRFFDSVNQSNLWLYIDDCLKKDAYQIYLISYENKDNPLTKEQSKRVALWKKKGLVWISLEWNPGTSLLAKSKDILKGFIKVASLRFRGCRHFISLASVAGTFLYLYSKVLRIRIFLYSYEPHSEYAVDNKMWSKNSLQYRISNYLEKKMAMNASIVASGTKFMEERLLKEWKIKGSFYKLPTVVNDKKFQFSAENRDKIRKRYGISEGTNLLFYPGKFGDLYYGVEIAYMFKWLLEEDNTFHFLIVTPHSDEEIEGLMSIAGVPLTSYTIEHADYEQVHEFFSAADFAVIAVPPGPSKKFISNIKVGEYLCAGLPFLITHGISEDYLCAMKKDVGVVVGDFNKIAIKTAVPKIQGYLNRDKDDLRRNCRNVGLEYRGFEKLNDIFSKALDQFYKAN